MLLGGKSRAEIAEISGSAQVEGTTELAAPPEPRLLRVLPRPTSFEDAAQEPRLSPAER